jgi:hypothetical protein
VANGLNRHGAEFDDFTEKRVKRDVSSGVTIRAHVKASASDQVTVVLSSDEEDAPHVVPGLVEGHMEVTHMVVNPTAHHLVLTSGRDFQVFHSDLIHVDLVAKKSGREDQWMHFSVMKRKIDWIAWLDPRFSRGTGC